MSPRTEVPVSLSKWFSRRMLVVTTTATALLGVSTVARAQVVRGTVVDQASGRALPATVVVLLDSTGKRLAGVLSGDDGTYAIRIAVPGRYALRAERIGFRAEAPTPVSIVVGQTLELKLMTRPIPVVLSEVKVTGRTTCVARASDGAEVSAVWDEARKALFATDLTQQQELFTVKLTRFERTFDPQTGRVLSHQSRQTGGVTRNPFVSLPAAELSENGFVRQSASDLIYFGPDAAVLLSDEFLNDHCFRIRDGSGRRSAMIGLAFEPARGREKPDIAGTLWLDQKTAELRDLEYVYRNLPGLPPQVASDEFGGRIEFHRMPTGAWIVEKWVIRMPVVVDRGRFARQDAIVPGTASRAERIQLAAIKEEGGEVTESVARGAHRTLASDVGTVRGIVLDSTRMLGLRDARVFLDGTQFSARSEPGGVFTIADVPTGTYTVSVAHPRFDSLQARAPSATVTLLAGEASVANLSGPSLATLAARDCTAYERTNGGAMLRGHVIDGSSGSPAPDALVTLTWNRLEVAITRVAAVSERQAVTRTDSAGRYSFCGLPDGVRLTARVAFDGRRSDAVAMLVASDELAVKDLVVGTETVLAAAEPAQTPITSTRITAPQNRAMQEVDRRRRRGNGSYLTRTQIERSNASRLTDLLRRMPSVSILPSDNGTIVVELRGSKRVTFASPTVRTDSGSSTTRLPGPPQGTSQMTVKNCPAGFLLDGLAIDAGSSMDLEMRPGLLEAIEVYSPAQVPIEYAGRFSECGVVMIWTRSFADRPDPRPGTDGER
jgi:hypothetical protein